MQDCAWRSKTDSETGLVLCGHRYYDPTNGRFGTRDPIGYNGGINLYGYVGGDPVKGADPSGLTKVHLGVSSSAAFAFYYQAGFAVNFDTDTLQLQCEANGAWGGGFQTPTVGPDINVVCSPHGGLKGGPEGWGELGAVLGPLSITSVDHPGGKLSTESSWSTPFSLLRTAAGVRIPTAGFSRGMCRCCAFQTY